MLLKSMRKPLALMRQSFVVACTGIALVLAGCVSNGGPAASVGPPPKNIIIMFADGAAPTQWDFGRYSSKLLRNQPFTVTDTVFKQGALGLLTTHPANAMVTDSAAAATAMSTGFKTDNFMIGVTGDAKPVRTLIEAAKAAGKRTGLATTSTVYDASPAGFSVHSVSRGDSQSIVDQYLVLEPDVLLGGGADYFLPVGMPGGKRKDGKDLIAAFAAKGYAVARNTEELKAASGTRLLGLFAADSMGFEIDRNVAKEPSTAEMTAAALRVLSQASPNGFVLFVENENIDTAGHHNDVAALMRALWAFDEAVRVALDFQKWNRDTLVVVASDHETGGLSITYAQRDLSPIWSHTLFFAGEDQVKLIGGITTSFGALLAKLGENPPPEALDKLFAQHYSGFRIDPDLRALVLTSQPLDRNFTYGQANVLGRAVSRQTGFYWGTSGHTTQPVLVGAMGPGAELFRGYQDNTEFGKHLLRLIDGK